MKSLFEGCSSLTSIPDLSKWGTGQVMEFDYLFKGCISLSSLPKINFPPDCFKAEITDNCISSINTLDVNS